MPTLDEMLNNIALAPDGEWFVVPSPFAKFALWGCWHGDWQYIVSYNSETTHWGASVKFQARGDRVDLGFDHITRGEAEAACNRHHQSTVQ